MKTDVRENKDSYDVFVDLPGFKKEDVKLDLDNGYLTISAQRNEELDDKDNEGRYIRQERATGSCARSFYVGKELEPKDISAKFENGILTLHLPKAEAKKLEPEADADRDRVIAKKCSHAARRGAILYAPAWQHPVVKKDERRVIVHGRI